MSSNFKANHSTLNLKIKIVSDPTLSFNNYIKLSLSTRNTWCRGASGSLTTIKLIHRALNNYLKNCSNWRINMLAPRIDWMEIKDFLRWEARVVNLYRCFNRLRNFSYINQLQAPYCRVRVLSNCDPNVSWSLIWTLWEQFILQGLDNWLPQVRTAL